MISTKNLEFSYDLGNSFSFPDFSTSAEPTLIIGPSGIGKTTLLHLMAGLIKPQKGEINWGKHNTRSLSSKELDKLRGKKVGIVFQKPHFLEALNVLENILLPLKTSNKNTSLEEINTCLESLGIANKSYSKIKELSEGEKQRVSIARALLNKPKYILADEPTSSLDDKNASEVIELLAEQSANYGCELVIITHDSRLKNKFSHTLNLEDNV